jgi:translation initiation factor 2 gamma subunit (eIF-2gamma)
MVYVNRLEKPTEGYLYKLEMTVFDIQPIARFVTGLLNEIYIIKNEDTINSYEEIKKYIETRVIEGMKINNMDLYQL